MILYILKDCLALIRLAHVSGFIRMTLQLVEVTMKHLLPDGIVSLMYIPDSEEDFSKTLDPDFRDTGIQWSPSSLFKLSSGRYGSHLNGIVRVCINSVMIIIKGTHYLDRNVQAWIYLRNDIGNSRFYDPPFSVEKDARV
ncbi:hypothetical protein CEXT_61761 [Caerostris extrusa]|uniref:Uncharacterized protein n=1 Tax=Caerostris extrusa TaxID=172846 RepID=A0AAV4X2J1_CAEEX|nr:hypothetical protein CEXT_61761 [Caerostris extrusa]